MQKTPFEHKARKRFGQNFLHDPNVLRMMVGAIHPKEDDALVEIGPGQGALTFPLLERLGKMTAIELDRDLIEPLRTQSLLVGELNIINIDALKFDFSTLIEDQRPLRVVGNLPYNISTPIIFHLLGQAENIKDMHFLLQKEVVDRIVASPGGKEYGRLSIMVQYHCKAEKLFHVGPGAFRPAPKVDSAFCRLTPLEQPHTPAKNYQRFSSLVQLCFSQRRKTLRRTLKNQLDEAAFENAGIDSNLRPEQLSVTDFVHLSNQFT